MVFSLNPRSRLATSEDGATAIEFAFLAGVLGLMVLGIIDFGRAFWFRMEVQNAAQAGADWAQYNPFNCGASPSPCNVNVTATSSPASVPPGLVNAVVYATDLSLTSANVTVTASTGGTTCGCPTATGISMGQTCGNACASGPNTYGNATGYATVMVTYNFAPIFPWPGLANPTTLSGSATALCKGGTTC